MNKIHVEKCHGNGIGCTLCKGSASTYMSLPVSRDPRNNDRDVYALCPSCTTELSRQLLVVQLGGTV